MVRRKREDPPPPSLSQQADVLLSSPQMGYGMPLSPSSALEMSLQSSLFSFTTTPSAEPMSQEQASWTSSRDSSESSALSPSSLPVRSSQRSVTPAEALSSQSSVTAPSHSMSSSRSSVSSSSAVSSSPNSSMSVVDGGGCEGMLLGDSTSPMLLCEASQEDENVLQDLSFSQLFALEDEKLNPLINSCEMLWSPLPPLQFCKVLSKPKKRGESRVFTSGDTKAREGMPSPAIGDQDAEGMLSSRRRLPPERTSALTLQARTDEEDDATYADLFSPSRGVPRCKKTRKRLRAVPAPAVPQQDSPTAMSEGRHRNGDDDVPLYLVFGEAAGAATSSAEKSTALQSSERSKAVKKRRKEMEGAARVSRKVTASTLSPSALGEDPANSHSSPLEKKPMVTLKTPVGGYSKDSDDDDIPLFMCMERMIRASAVPPPLSLGPSATSSKVTSPRRPCFFIELQKGYQATHARLLRELLVSWSSAHPVEGTGPIWHNEKGECKASDGVGANVYGAEIGEVEGMLVCLLCPAPQTTIAEELLWWTRQVHVEHALIAPIFAVSVESTAVSRSASSSTAAASKADYRRIVRQMCTGLGVTLSSSIAVTTTSVGLAVMQEQLPEGHVYRDLASCAREMFQTDTISEVSLAVSGLLFGASCKEVVLQDRAFSWMCQWSKLAETLLHQPRRPELAIHKLLHLYSDGKASTLSVGKSKKRDSCLRKEPAKSAVPVPLHYGLVRPVMCSEKTYACSASRRDRLLSAQLPPVMVLRRHLSFMFAFFSLLFTRGGFVTAVNVIESQRLAAGANADEGLEYVSSFTCVTTGFLQYQIFAWVRRYVQVRLCLDFAPLIALGNPSAPQHANFDAQESRVEAVATLASEKWRTVLRTASCTCTPRPLEQIPCTTDGAKMCRHLAEVLYVFMREHFLASGADKEFEKIGTTALGKEGRPSEAAAPPLFYSKQASAFGNRADRSAKHAAAKSKSHEQVHESASSERQRPSARHDGLITKRISKQQSVQKTSSGKSKGEKRACEPTPMPTPSPLPTMPLSSLSSVVDSMEWDFPTDIVACMDNMNREEMASSSEIFPLAKNKNSGMQSHSLTAKATPESPLRESESSLPLVNKNFHTEALQYALRYLSQRVGGAEGEHLTCFTHPQEQGRTPSNASPRRLKEGTKALKCVEEMLRKELQ